MSFWTGFADSLAYLKSGSIIRLQMSLLISQHEIKQLVETLHEEGVAMLLSVRNTNQRLGYTFYAGF